MNERKEEEAFSPFRAASRKVETNGGKIAGWNIDETSGGKFVRVWSFALVALFIGNFFVFQSGKDLTLQFLAFSKSWRTYLNEAKPSHQIPLLRCRSSQPFLRSILQTLASYFELFFHHFKFSKNLHKYLHHIGWNHRTLLLWLHLKHHRMLPAPQLSLVIVMRRNSLNIKEAFSVMTAFWSQQTTH